MAAFPIYSASFPIKVLLQALVARTINLAPA